MAQEGIATLPQSPENAAPPPEVAMDSGKNELLNQFGPEAMSEYERTMDQAAGQLNIPLDQLQMLQQIIDYILKNVQNYPEIRKELLAKGIREEDLPPEFDAGYFGSMQVMVGEAVKRAMGTAPQVSNQGPEMAPPEGSPLPPVAPQGFARGGLADAAESLRRKGRGGDTILAHINPQEAQMLKRMGGAGTINPATGLPEFLNIRKELGNAWSSVKSVAAPILKSPVAKVLATVALTYALGPSGAQLMSAPIAAAVSAGSITALGGGDLKSSLISAATGFGMATLAPGISDMLPGAGGYLNAAATGAIMGAGYGLATGQNLRQVGLSALTGGALAGGMSYARGAEAYGRGAEGQGGVFSRDTPAPISDSSQNVSLQPDGTYGPNPVNVAMPDPYSIGDYASNIANQSGTLLPGEVPVDTPTMGTSTFDRSMSNASRFGVDMGSSEVQPTFSSSAPTSAGSGSGAGAPKSGFMDYVPDFFKTAKGDLSIPATTAAVLGIGAITGGFDQQDPGSPGLVERDAQGNVITGNDLVEQNPDKYIYRPDIRTAPVGPYDPNTTSPNDINMIRTRQFGDIRQTPYDPFTAPTMGGRTPSGISSALPQPYNTADMYDFMRPRRAFADGGITQAYPRRKGGISGPGTGTSDDIPAMLSDGEFVLTAKAVRGAGKGSRREGAKKLYRMMHALEKKAK